MPKAFVRIGGSTRGEPQAVLRRCSATLMMVRGLINPNNGDIRHVLDLTENTIITLVGWYDVAAPLAGAFS